MVIGIPLSKHAYTPEAYAYKKYLTALGHNVQLDYHLDPNNDINVYFMGTRPFWKRKEGRALEIHEYQSLSTPPYAILKNYAKKIVNSVPRGRIFLNDIVYKGMKFNDNIPYIYRDMGVDDIFFQKPNENPLYDIVYCGSITGRLGLIDNILKLSANFKVVIIGNISDEERSYLNHENVTLLGALEREKIPDIYREAKYGLNFTPDIYPFNVQTSTKTLEYLSSGLKVISNKYFWAENISNEIDEFIWLDDVYSNPEILYKDYMVNADMSDFLWGNILKKSKFESFVINIK